ncbi:uncharacterized protein BDZ99DRAFT_491501 [Mytilinidion resinicola]|uniref:Impact N-terminal domain-containing protein n=1 Tax=Mytilinidion resinicola TaxID=574789 RepID=A0A6A6Y4S8_9PEZI|nr:uncharacterized protein BDZ99DRAFT_491501 [Mytilinidion resinicola]KAF2803792.1 hypothetical protein BDZ99DRAFT_491501 [Mytilinidion resinicola]
MANAASIQSLLRFLSQDAKLPLALAMSKIKSLQTAGLGTPTEISKSNISALKTIFTDEKLAKQILSAAKRVSKKRGPTDGPTPPALVKKAKPSYGEPLTPAALEDSLALPESDASEEELGDVVLFTNRAPLVLAFAVALVKYTMPEQPVSSRLSLAQAVVSANSRTKAVSLGLESGKSAEEEGWGEGQPVVKIMGREIRVMKRWGYEWDVKDEAGATQETVNEQSSVPEDVKPALWGLDLEKLKKHNGPLTHGAGAGQLPIYTAQGARAYLLKSFELAAKEVKVEEASEGKKRSNSSKSAEKERNLGLLLRALDLLYQSWSTLETDELNRRAWSWYVRVRPEVENGVAGWGGKGDVKLSDILALRKTV